MDLTKMAAFLQVFPVSKAIPPITYAKVCWAF